ncbi:SpoIIE family protein phosphatase [Kitasatospora sp. NPDC017646]|uniref:SpoIIE family protein phosphatase n=1 Tax=Kitasatospora sp. NPDC017646 TaxID=3364024 RepID=UPI003788AC7B
MDLQVAEFSRGGWSRAGSSSDKARTADRSPSCTPRHAGSIGFDRGDLLLLSTDGASEARDAASRFHPLAQRLATLPHGEPDALLDELLLDVRAHVGSGPTDDAALLAVRRER